jgi:hypothetical protein
MRRIRYAWPGFIFLVSVLLSWTAASLHAAESTATAERFNQAGRIATASPSTATADVAFDARDRTVHVTVAANDAMRDPAQ